MRRTRASMPEAKTSPGEGRATLDVEPGDRVRVRSLDREATVLELRGESVTVEAGGVRLTLPAGDLEPAPPGDEEGRERRAPDPAARRAEARPSIEAKPEVHLRGLRVDEVERELLPLLDAAVVADLPRFRIVHGKGTGALRQKVREILASDPRVARYRPGEPGEGGSGVTVVEFGEE